MRKAMAVVLLLLLARSCPGIVHGEVVSCGDDIYGEVSNVPIGSCFTAVAAGRDHQLALQLDGSILGWGKDNLGQVSDKPTDTGYTAIAGGFYHSLALKNDGSIVSWGDDSYGQVSDTPTGTGHTAIAAGGCHSLALKSDGSIVSWGVDVYGEVNDTPTGTGHTAIATGSGHSLALKSDGSIVSWGRDDHGQVSDTPGGTDFVAIAGGTLHSLALKGDGSIVSWGYDVYGQVSDTPTDTGYTAIAAGFYHSLALKMDGSIVDWGVTSYGLDGKEYVMIDAGSGHSVALRVVPVPYVINYQGSLNGATGDPYSGPDVGLRFRFYDEYTAGNLLLTVFEWPITVTQGLFNVMIGSGIVTEGTVDSLREVFESHGAVWMSVELHGDEEMTPRKRIGSVGYALKLAQAEMAKDLTHIAPRFTAVDDPVAGDLYIDASDGNRLKVYDGTAWQACW